MIGYCRKLSCTLVHLNEVVLDVHCDGQMKQGAHALYRDLDCNADKARDDERRKLTTQDAKQIIKAVAGDFSTLSCPLLCSHC